MHDGRRRPYRVSGHAEIRVRQRLGFTAPSELWDAFMAAIDERRCAWRQGNHPNTRVYMFAVVDPECPDAELTLPIVFDVTTREFITVYDLEAGES